MWHSPIKYKLIPTDDSESFKKMPAKTTGLPLTGHVGAFGHQRKHDIHTGVDLYVPVGTPVFAVESGVVVTVEPFTGPKAGFEWWHDTDAVYIKGNTGVILYGEITPIVKPGDLLEKGALVGHVIPVLKKDKGRPTSMLHLELHNHDSTTWYVWQNIKNKPIALLDPTPYLLPLCN